MQHDEGRTMPRPLSSSESRCLPMRRAGQGNGEVKSCDATALVRFVVAMRMLVTAANFIVTPRPRASPSYENRLTPIADPQPLVGRSSASSSSRCARRGVSKHPRSCKIAKPTWPCVPGVSRTTPAASSKCRIACAGGTRRSSSCIRGASTTARAGRRRSRRARHSSARPRRT